MNAIELSHVTKRFPGFTLQDLSLTVPSGTICGLVGENGAGKSTTIRLLMGALRPDSGTCTVLGADSAAPEFLSLKEDIGVVLDEAYFPEVLNVSQVGKMLSRTYRQWDSETYRALLERFTSAADDNFINYQNTDYDALFQQAQATADDAEQTELYKQMERNLTEHAANVYIQDLADLVVLRNGLEGYQFYPIYVMDLSTVHYAQ